MVFQTHHRRFPALLSAVVIASTIACGNQQPENKITRRGEDLLASGSTPTVADSVPGDAILGGRDLSFSGATGGDYLGAGGQQAITGRIHGSLRAAGGEIHVAATVDRNTTIAGGNVELDSVGVFERNAYLLGGTVQVNGTVRGDILAWGGKVSLNGVVGRDVEVAGEALTVGPHAQITGNLRYRVPAGKVHIDPAARISGTVTALPVSGGWGLLRLLWILGILVAGSVAVALFPGFAAEAARILAQNPGRSGLVGLGWLCLVPIAIVIAAITVIGLPLALVTVALYLVVVSFASVPFSLWLGQRLLSGRARTGRQGALVSFLVGAFILLVVGLIPVVGALAMLIAVIFGLGTIMIRTQAVRERQPTLA